MPDTILFRAGGDDSVRGYDYRTLGPTVNGAVVGGRVLLDRQRRGRACADSSALPALLGAVFVDAGNAADRWNELHPVFGYGVGVHYRSPVGPLRLDVAYGEDVRRCAPARERRHHLLSAADDERRHELLTADRAARAQCATAAPPARLSRWLGGTARRCVVARRRSLGRRCSGRAQRRAASAWLLGLRSAADGRSRRRDR